MYFRKIRGGNMSIYIWTICVQLICIMCLPPKGLVWSPYQLHSIISRHVHGGVCSWPWWQVSLHVVYRYSPYTFYVMTQCCLFQSKFSCVLHKGRVFTPNRTWHRWLIAPVLNKSENHSCTRFRIRVEGTFYIFLLFSSCLSRMLCYQ